MCNYEAEYFDRKTKEKMCEPCARINEQIHYDQNKKWK